MQHMSSLIRLCIVSESLNGSFGKILFLNLIEIIPILTNI